ncbi:transglutaminase [Flavobacterium sp. IR1]|nr:transglutaminase [Flavobacterium sp. IR1]
MKIIKTSSILIFILFITSGFAQDFRLGKVSSAELLEKFHPKDTTASAAVLYEKGKSRIEYDVNDGFITVLEVEARIKIYKKGGYDLANKSVLYQNVTGLVEKVSFSDVYTYNLVDGKIEKTKLKSDGVFDEMVNKFYRTKKIAMPNVKEGSVIEYKYVIRSSSDRRIRDWNFQSFIPVNYSEFNTYIPEYYVFNSRQKGYLFPKVTKVTSNKTVTFVDKYRSNDYAVKTRYDTSKWDYVENQTTYIAENFPALKEESYVNNIDNYTSTVEHELSMVQFPNQTMKLYSTDWNAVVKTIYNYENFGPELTKSGYYEDDVKALLVGKESSEQKIMAILNHVKSSVKWNGYVGYGCDNGVKKAYKEKSGNTADINLMLTSMLRYAGLTANPVLVSTRSNGISFYPNRNAFNYVITAVEMPGGYVLLDATDSFSAPNILPLKVLNWQGRLIRKDGTSVEIDLMPSKASVDNVFVNYSIDTEGKVTGKTRRQCTDYNAMITRTNFYGTKEEEYLEKLENQNNKIEISEYSRTNEKEILLPIIENYSFIGSDLCELIGGKIYVNPMLFFTNSKNPFTQEVREYPVDFGFPFTDKYNITIQIPEGFMVEAMPESAVIAMEDNVGVFRFNIAANGNVLQVSVLHQINNAIVSTEKYEMLKEYYKVMIAKETEKIVLKKI